MPPPRQPLVVPARRALRLAALALVAIAALGCAKSKREHCDTLIDTINPHTQALSRAVEKLASVQTDATVVDALSKVATDADASIRGIELTDKRLQSLAAAYREQLQTAIALADDIAAADGKTAQLYGLVNAADALIARQDEILAELNEYCATGS
ncbi:MAG: hypothetical protein JKY37_20485 [Nannocystaceae bacterium]|nr:hypothetical protein [Nannocystaceae bacterium]